MEKDVIAFLLEGLLLILIWQKVENVCFIVWQGKRI